ncbi:unnamed protein product, partial [Symbiodinium sp. CCMP2456]
RAGCAGTCGILGSPWPFRRWRHGHVQATKGRRAEARTHLHVGLHRLHHPGVLQMAGIPVPREGPQVQRDATRNCSDFQGTTGRLAADRAVHRPLRGLFLAA